MQDPHMCTPFQVNDVLTLLQYMYISMKSYSLSSYNN